MFRSSLVKHLSRTSPGPCQPTGRPLATLCTRRMLPQFSSHLQCPPPLLSPQVPRLPPPVQAATSKGNLVFLRMALRPVRMGTASGITGTLHFSLSFVRPTAPSVRFSHSFLRVIMARLSRKDCCRRSATRQLQGTYAPCSFSSWLSKS